MSQLLLCSIVMQNLRIFYGGPVMFVVTCFSVLLVSQWFQHFLMWLLVFSNSKILIVLILLCPIPSLNWAIKSSLNLVSLSFENTGSIYNSIKFYNSFTIKLRVVSLETNYLGMAVTLKLFNIKNIKQCFFLVFQFHLNALQVFCIMLVDVFIF